MLVYPHTAPRTTTPGDGKKNNEKQYPGVLLWWHFFVQDSDNSAYGLSLLALGLILDGVTTSTQVQYMPDGKITLFKLSEIAKLVQTLPR